MMVRLLISMIVLIGSSVLAGEFDNGIESPFSFGTGARDLSLGGASLAVGDVTTAPFWNAARLNEAEHISFGIFHANLYESEVAYQYMGIAYPTLDYGTFGLGVFRQSVSGIERRTSEDVYLGDFSLSQIGFHLAYGRSLSSYDVGISASLESHSLDTYSATSSPAVHLFVGRRLTPRLNKVEHISLVVSARNVIQPGIKLAEETYSYPREINIAASAGIAPITKWGHTATVSTRLAKTEHMDAAVSLGLEYNIDRMLHMRLGLNEGHASAGVGIVWKGFSFDYALVGRDLGSLHMFTLNSSFGRPVSEQRAERQKQRELEFNSLMKERLTGRNRDQARELVIEGQRQISEGHLGDALSNLDRALFLARSVGDDTTSIAELANTTRIQLETSTRAERFDSLIDSAQTKLAEGDLLGARYFANLAESESPRAAIAQEILEEVNQLLTESEETEELVAQRLLTVDSLLDMGRLRQADQAIESLLEFSPDHNGVLLRLTRLEIDRWRRQVTDASGSYEVIPSAGLDSLAAMFPHSETPVVAVVPKDIEPGSSVSEAPQPTLPPGSEINPDLLDEVRDMYREAKRSFEQGDLERAIVNWEKIEKIAPDYESVRSYLVSSYKFLGVGLYGQMKRKEALAVWRKATALDPYDVEVVEYIRQTENEIQKLLELSHEQN